MVHIGLSIGCSFYPAHGESAVELCKSADQAMYREKLSRRTNDRASSL
ncbi:MAG: diguanylate cyclase [Burkholderiales bacterium]|nr:MAG: diguanylate cyclase [Burkholderiales bacterium]